jgi:crotonobetainyl-CoA:carnitine CoA-transferase CaiB-like acyl-CoA transferase
MGQGIFQGLKVIDCASFIAAPSSATALSDFGADVIKIEPPGAGDPVRNLPNLPGYPISNHNYAWMLEGRNKKSLALDLSKPEGQAVLRKLAAEADVFISNFPPPVRKKLGVTYKDLAPLNDRLIYASFTGYGETGAEADKPGFDSNAWWARSGLMDLVRETDDTVPARSMPGMGDHPCAMSLFAGIVTALYQRERTGKGTQVMSNLMVNGIWSNGIYAQAALCGATFQKRPPRDRALNGLTCHYKCSDGRWIILSLLNEEKQFPVFAKVIEREELLADPRFETKTARHRHAPELIAILDKVFATKPLAHWRKTLDGNGLIFGVVGIPTDIPDDPQMRETEAVVPFADSDLRTINTPIFIEGAKKVQPRMAPNVGQHSDEVLAAAGFTAAEIAKMRAAGIVA